jgi:hypothetical protein
MLQAGSGTRSGSADRGGLVMVRIAAVGGRGGVPCDRRMVGGRQHPGIGQHRGPLTTLTLTVAVASRAEMRSSRRYEGATVSVIW